VHHCCMEVRKPAVMYNVCVLGAVMYNICVLGAVMYNICVLDFNKINQEECVGQYVYIIISVLSQYLIIGQQ
jgi:hypothetical protein